MASTKVVSRLSTRLQPFLFKLNKKSLSAELSSLKSSSLPTQVSVPATTRRLSRSSRLPLQLSCVESMLPLHSAVASARCLDAFMTVSFMGTFDKVKMSGCFMLHFFSLILQSQH
ncbi:hypothetical protein NC653_039737 [Populus alba x Populus x berolinensis]|uniref:Uncharacterized protein n=1 Tax=Populus alba x Populus x berolinensis TaxID=444605 RepID=A0AAD6LBX6_9ROSI|nr:hypothetical protein NC653_039737 [Populus alba x Populus x berolinensis]